MDNTRSNCKTISSRPSKSTCDHSSATMKGSKSSCGVRFSSWVMLVPALALDDFTDEEFDGTWTTSEEDERSQQHLVETLKILRTNSGVVPQHLQVEFTELGLERFISNSARQKFQNNRAHHVNTILRVQDDVNASTGNTEDIAQTSETMTLLARECALVAANNLAAEISEE